MRNLAMVLIDLGREPEAKALFERAVEVIHQATPTTPFVYNVPVAYAGFFMDQRRFPEAEAVLLKTLPRVREQLGEDHKMTLRVTGNLADLYDAWDKSKQATRARATSAEPDTP